MPLSVNDFIQRLTSSGILSAEEVAKVTVSLSQSQLPKNAQALAKLLVKQGKLTKYQAAAIYQGKTQGLVLGNYVILDKIGAGGMGQVFKALHRRMDRVVALKVLPAEAMKSPDNIQRFHREVKAAARLEHPNIVTAYDADEADGVHFLVMQYVEGSDLSELLKKNGPFPVPQAVECVRQAAVGLAYAHAHGVVHRDIKPANLLLASGERKVPDFAPSSETAPHQGANAPRTPAATVKILDMGLARLEGHITAETAPPGLTQSGQIMGTVDYMSPEQAEETRGVDARADQYSLGCTLWVLLTGRPMFEATTTIAKLMAHRTTPAPSLCAARADVPEALEAVYQRMVAKEVDDRYASMDEVVAALETCLGEAASAQLDSASSSDSALTDFLQQVAGARTAAPPRTTPAIDAETMQRLPVKEETGTQHVIREGEAPAEPLVDPRVARVKLSAKSAAAPWLLIGSGLASLLLLIAAAGGLMWLFNGDAEPSRTDPGESTTPVAIDAGPTPPLAVAPFDEATAKEHQRAWADYLGLPVEHEIDLPGGAKLTMMLIPPGEFLMGSTDEERAKFLERATVARDKFAADRIPSEGPQHRVRITKAFYLGKTEVTQAQWKSVIETNPSHFKNAPSHPVEQVSWDDIQPFLMKLNEGPTAAGMKFVLPTEAQWEYACRAGTTTYFFSSDLRKHVWFNANSGDKTQPVGRLQANGFGLYDMHGNVWEWCTDGHAMDYYAKSPKNDPTGPSLSSQRVFRGGSWRFGEGHCRSAFRGHDEPGFRVFSLGFRLAAAIDVAKLTAERNSPVNYALDFDGRTSYVEIPKLQLPNGPLTVEAWITPRRANYGSIFVASGESFVSLNMFEETLGFWREAPNFVKSINHKPLTPGPRVHVAGVWDGQKLHAYVNGQARGQQHVPVLQRTEQGLLTMAMIGGEQSNGKVTRRFDGRIDELRVSTIARYTQDFNVVAPFGRMQADEHTLALYHFDEGDGEVLRDSSGNEHHGKIVGAKWVQASEGREPPESAPPQSLGEFTLDFSNGTHVLIPALKRPPKSAFTLEAWVRYEAEETPPETQAIFGDSLAKLEVSHGQKWKFYGTGNEDPVQIYSTQSVRPEWTHVAVVYDGHQSHLFVDGRGQGAAKAGTLALWPRSGFVLGAMLGEGEKVQSCCDFTGQIGEARVSSIARYEEDFQPARRLEADNHTLGLYHFDEGAGDVLRDSSGNEHHGKIVGAKWVRVDQDGNDVDYELMFDGTSAYVEIPGTAYTSGEPITLEAFVTVAPFDEIGKHQPILGFSGIANLNLYQSRESYFFANGYAVEPRLVQRVARPVEVGRRVHLAAVYDGRYLQLYRDGMRSDERLIDGDRAYVPEDKPLTLEQRFTVPTLLGTVSPNQVAHKELFQGRIDEVRVSSVARYDKNFAVPRRFSPDADTIALYHCDEGADDVLQDSSGNNHHGKIVGAKWVRVANGAGDEGQSLPR